MVRRLGIAVLLVAAMGAALWLVATQSRFLPVIGIVLLAAVVVGIAVRTVRGAHKGTLSQGMTPAAQGMDEVQDMYLGRLRVPTTYGTEPAVVATEVHDVTGGLYLPPRAVATGDDVPPGKSV